jgi:hypothetical protein
MSRVLKVCFMIDCTASMKKWIDAAKIKIKKMLDELCERNKDYKISVALIGYRDFGEKMYRLDFTEDYMSLYMMLLDMKADGGKDAAEDVSGAYCWLTCLKWDGDKNVVFHIADAPDHGIMYHDDTVSDNYPEGHPFIDLREEVKKLGLNEIDLTLFRINKTTDIMYDIIRKNYNKIRLDGVDIIDFRSYNDTENNVFYEQVISKLNTVMESTY